MIVNSVIEMENGVGTHSCGYHWERPTRRAVWDGPGLQCIKIHYDLTLSRDQEGSLMVYAEHELFGNLWYNDVSICPHRCLYKYCKDLDSFERFEINPPLSIF